MKNDFEYCNSTLPGFVKELFYRCTFGAGIRISKFVKYIWYPVCRNCADRELACLTKTEPCYAMSKQKMTRMIALILIITIPSLAYLLYHAENRWAQVKKAQQQQIEQTK